MKPSCDAKAQRSFLDDAREADFAGADIDPTGMYRYDLRRSWPSSYSSLVNFVMLNPSKADATVSDPTMKRCVEYAKSWGFGRLVLTNLYAFRATKPEDMRRASDPIGPLNDDYIRRWASEADRVVLAWGALPPKCVRDAHVKSIIVGLGITPYAIRLTKDGYPGHPLFLPKSLPSVPISELRTGGIE